jgi:tetratricopeptide (TPR) repeat protein
MIDIHKAYGDTLTKLGMVLYNEVISKQNENTLKLVESMGINFGTDGASSFETLDLSKVAFGGGGDFGGGAGGGLGDITAQIEDILAMFGGGGSSATAQADAAAFQEELTEQLQQAADYCDEAIMIYQQHLNTLQDDDDRIQYLASLVMTYSQASTIAIANRQLIRGRELMNHGLTIQLTELLPYYERSNENGQILTTKTTIGTLYISLAELSLQLGDYQMAKDAYRNTMVWYKEHQLDPALATSVVSIITGTGILDTSIRGSYGQTVDYDFQQYDDAIKLFQQQLDQYRSMKNGGGGAAATMMLFMTLDDTYEAELLSSLGSMYLSKADYDTAIKVVRTQTLDMNALSKPCKYSHSLFFTFVSIPLVLNNSWKKLLNYTERLTTKPPRRVDVPWPMHGQAWPLRTLERNVSRRQKNLTFLPSMRIEICMETVPTRTYREC